MSFRDFSILSVSRRKSETIMNEASDLYVSSAAKTGSSNPVSPDGSSSLSLSSIGVIK